MFAYYDDIYIALLNIHIERKRKDLTHSYDKNSNTLGKIQKQR